MAVCYSLIIFMQVSHWSFLYNKRLTDKPIHIQHIYSLVRCATVVNQDISPQEINDNHVLKNNFCFVYICLSHILLLNAIPAWYVYILCYHVLHFNLATTSAQGLNIMEEILFLTTKGQVIHCNKFSLPLVHLPWEFLLRLKNLPFLPVLQKID